MSIWMIFDGEITLSGKEYDGRGFGLRGVWFEERPLAGNSRTHWFKVLKDGRVTRHHTTCTFKKAFRETNMPCGSEGSSVVDILTSDLDGSVHIRFSRALRGLADSEAVMEWVINFLKERRKEGWFVRCRIAYGIDALPKSDIVVENQNFAMEYRRLVNGKVQTWRHHLDKDLSEVIGLEDM